MAALFWPFWFSKLAQEALHRERERRVFTRMCTCVYVCLQTRCSDVRKAVPVRLRPPALLLTSCGGRDHFQIGLAAIHEGSVVPAVVRSHPGSRRAAHGRWL